MHYTISLLEAETNPRSLICLFPQGELRPWTSDSIDFKPGLEWLVRKLNITVNLIMLAMRCEFLEKKHAEVFFLCSENFQTDANSFKGIDWAQEMEATLLNELAKKIMNREEGKINSRK